MKQISIINSILLFGILMYLLFSGSEAMNGKAKILPEITTERLNIVDKKGNKYMVLSNPQKQALATQDGEIINPDKTERNTAGLLFFNEEGDEVGGLVYGIDSLGSYQLLTFDQHKNDQIMVLKKDEYIENGEWKKQYGLLLQERSDKSSKAIVSELNTINNVKDSTLREQRLRNFYSQPQHQAPQRLFLGRTYSENVGLYLMDKHNQPKLVIYVDKSGEPHIESFDSEGNKKEVIL